jgi:hypothetical protein
MTVKSPAPPPELNTMRIDVDGEIGTLTLDRPDSLNAMNPELIGELVIAAAWLADRAPLRALIVTGAGDRAFSSGGDVNWFKKGVDSEDFDLPADVRRGADVLHQAIVDFRRIPYPVIGAINGVAAGAGFSLALMCDTRIASENASFVCAYGRIGASPDGGMTYFLPRMVGPARAAELMRWIAPGTRLRSWRRRRLTTFACASSCLRRASTTRSPTIFSSSDTGSPTPWGPRICVRASAPSSSVARRRSPGAEPRLAAHPCDERGPPR